MQNLFKKTNLKPLDFKIIFLLLPHGMILCLISFNISLSSISTSASKFPSFPSAFIIVILHHDDGSDKEVLRCSKIKITQGKKKMSVRHT